MCDEAVRIGPLSLAYVPDRFKTKEMCNKIMRKNPAAFNRIPEIVKTQEMGIKAVSNMQWHLEDVPDHFKTQEMCNKVVKGNFFLFVVCTRLFCNTATTKAILW